MFIYFVYQFIGGKDNLLKHYAFSKEMKVFCICIKFYPPTPPFNLS